MAMRTDVKEMFSLALESNRYPQGVGQLKAAEGWCCLGVLGCVLKERFNFLLEQAGWDFDIENGEFFRFVTVHGEEIREVEETQIPDEVAEAIGLFGPTGEFPLNPELSLARLNDEYDMNFAQIGAVVRGAF